MKTFKTLCAFLTLAALFGGLIWGAVKLSEKRKEQARIAHVDQTYAEKADALLEKALREDSELTMKFGKLRTITGRGHHRAGGWSLITRFELERTAQFERGTVRVNVIVPRNDAKENGTEDLRMQRWDLSTYESGSHHLEAWLGPVSGPITKKEHTALTGQTITPSRSSKNQQEQQPAPVSAAPRERPEPISDAALSADTTYIYLARSDKLEVWHRSSGKLERTITGLHGGVSGLRPAASGTRLALTMGDSSTRVYDTATGNLEGSAPSYGKFHAADISADGSRLLTSFFKINFVGKDQPPTSQIGLITAIPGSTGTPLIEPAARPASKASGFWLSPDGRHAIATPDTGRTLRIWDVDTAAITGTITLPENSLGEATVTFFPRSSRLVTCAASGSKWSLVTWEFASGKSLATHAIPSPSYDYQELHRSHLIVSADETLIALGLRNGKVVVLDTATLTPLTTTTWKLEGSISNPNSITWDSLENKVPPRFTASPVSKAPAANMMGLRFSASAPRTLHAISISGNVCWHWTCHVKTGTTATTTDTTANARR